MGYHAAHVAAGSGRPRVTAAFILTLATLGFVGAFVSGLVGVGGAIVMIPLLYYVPRFIRARQGINIGFVYKELPPE